VSALHIECRDRFRLAGDDDGPDVLTWCASYRLLPPGGGGRLLLVLGAVFAAIAVLSDSGWALIAGTAREWFVQAPHRLATIDGDCGLAMIGIGASLGLSDRND
jgi:hypothetical protein